MEKYVLKNDELEVEVLNYGAIVHKIIYKNKNMVLSYEHLEDYITYPDPYLNAFVGPVAGRIKDGVYNDLKLTINNGSNHLHGGLNGASFAYFDMVSHEDTKLVLRHSCNHDKDGYVGTYTYTIIFLLNKSTLEITHDVICDRPALLVPTHHLYFNLGQDLSKGIENHILTADFKKMLYVDETCAPSQVVELEEGHPFNFSKGQYLQAPLNSDHPQFDYTKGIDHPYFINGPICLYNQDTNIELKIETTAPCVVLYSSNFIDETTPFEGGQKGYQHIALAMETQNVPNGYALNLLKEKTHEAQITKYQFSLK